MPFFDDLSLMLGNIVTRKVDRQLFDWMRAVSDWIDGGTVFSDFNTLVPGNLALANWTSLPAAIDAFTVMANAGSVYGPAGTAAEAVWINPGGVAGGVGEGSCVFAPPSGVSTVNVRLRAAIPQGFAIPSSTLYFEVRTSAGVLIVSGTQALTNLIAEYDIFVDVPVAYPTEYVVNVFCNQAPSSVQAQAIVEWVKVEPSIFTPGMWRDDLYRIELDPSKLQGGYDLFARGRYWTRQAYTQTFFRTDAPIFYFQQFCNNAGQNGCPLRINGQEYATLFLSTGNSTTPVWDYPSVSLDRNVMNLVELDSSLNNQGPGPTGSKPDNLTGTFPTAIYVPRGYRMQFLERVTQRETFTIYGDSIVNGIGVPFPELNGIAQQLRRILPYDVVSESIGARSLVGDIIFNGSLAALARVVTKNRPRILWIQVGTNDYGGAGGGTSAVAVWQADLQALLVECNRLVTDIQIFVECITERSFMGANANGDTGANYQAAAAAAVAAVALANVAFVDASLWIIAAQTADGLHPNQFGQSIIVQHMWNVLRTAGLA